MSLIGLSHPRAITPIADPIHDRIEFNLFDRSLIDSAFFQRLHFVLQNSATYTSYPANKNSRFPHSLGVSYVAGNMFSRALSNGSYAVVDSFFSTAADFLERLCGQLSDGQNDAFSKESDFAELQQAHLLTISGLAKFLHSPIARPPTSDEWKNQELTQKYRIDTTKTYGSEHQFTAAFIADTYWQAIRLYGLMHDIGHLPMSHAFEAALDSQYALFSVNVAPGDSSEARSEYFRKIYNDRRDEFAGIDDKFGRDYYTKFFSRLLDADQKNIMDSTYKNAFHEIRGISIFNKYVKDFKVHFSEQIHRYGKLINYLCLAIIYSKSISSEFTGNDNPHRFSFLFSIKQIVDGEVDADRLDYTIRDGVESGTDIGVFDLNRVISNSVIVNNPKTGEFSFGFYFRALSGLEQFYEQRYQSYKYIIYHRTSSRTNKCLEHLIALIINYTFIFPTSDCADILESSGYIERGPSGAITRILPDNEDHIYRIDDANLRTLLFTLLTLFKAKKYKPDASDLAKRMEKEMATLAEVVLLRKLENILTLHKNKRLATIVTSAIDEGASAGMARQFTEYLLQNEPTLTTEIRDAFVSYVGEESQEPLTVIVDKISPKVYNSRRQRNRSFAQRVWIVKSDGQVGEIDQLSSTLRTMWSRDRAETQIRIYIISKNIKERPIDIVNIEIFFEKFIKEKWRKFVKSEHQLLSKGAVN